MSNGMARSAPAESLVPKAEEVRDRALVLGRALAARARGRTSLACERAVLRLCGVGGLAVGGRPLALDVVDRLGGAGPGALGRGVGLPFAVASTEYGLDPQQLALDVAAGHIDLATEGELLADEAIRREAQRMLQGWLAGAFERFDANRTARRELIAMLGEPPEPWIGSDVGAFDARGAASEAASLVTSGADLLRVRVPRDAEIRRGPREASGDSDWPVGPAAPPPAGSQRGLSLLRAALDDAATRSGRYPRLATSWLGLAAPEQAVVAGFERVDVVCSDPFEAVFGLGVDPDRAFADHAFAQALLTRAGCHLFLGPGPLVAPEGGLGADLDPATRAGRALAIQAVGLGFALDNGVPAERISLGAVPPAAFVGGGSGAHALAEVALRGLVFPEHALVFDEHLSETADESLAPALLAWAAGGARFRAVISPAARSHVAAATGAIRGAMVAARFLADGREVGGLRGPALEHAGATLDAAAATLAALERDGFEAFVGPDDGNHVGAAGLAERDSGAPAIEVLLHPQA